MRRSPARTLRVAAALPLAMLGAVVAPGTASAAPADPACPTAHYRLIDLGLLGSDGITYAYGLARAINDRGDVVGISSTANGHVHPFLWHAGTLTDLGVLEPGNWEAGYAADINNRGDVVGSSTVGSGQHAFLWRDGVLTDLGTVGGGVYSGAAAVNDRGQVLWGGITATYEGRSLLWDNGHVTDLGAISGSDLNDRGQVTGDITVASEEHGALLSRGKLTDLGTLPGGNHSEANAINNAGWIVGLSTNGTLTGRAFLWRSGTMVELPNLDGADSAAATGLNDRGQIIGYSGTGGYNRPALWQHGRVIDLSTRTDACSTGARVIEVSGINNLGQMAVTCRSTVDGMPRPGLLVP